MKVIKNITTIGYGYECRNRLFFYKNPVRARYFALDSDSIVLICI